MSINQPFVKNKLRAVVLLLISISLNAQPKFTPEQFREDLRFLQKTVHKDFPFLFKKTTAEAFDKEVEKLYQAIPQLADHEVLVGLVRLVAMFDYGHTILGYWEEKIPLHQLEVVLYEYDDGIFVQGVHTDYPNILGAKLLAIEGMPVKDVLKAMRPVVPAENESFVKAYGLHYLKTSSEFLHAQGVIREMSTSIEFTLEKDGVHISDQLILGWDVNETVGFENSISVADDTSLHLLLEKDFVCLDERIEDQSDNYPNPKMLTD